MQLLCPKGEYKLIVVARKTTESKIRVSIDFEKLAEDYRKKIKTPIMFLNHMIEHIAYRAGFTIELEMELAEIYLSHVVCEDLGQTMGRAIAEYVKSTDVIGYGDAIGMIDEALAVVAIGFEGRSRFVRTYDVPVPSVIEGMDKDDLEAFLDGFVQGANCTLHVLLRSGENGHHIFESIFRALGRTLANALEVNESRRKGLTAGVAREIIWEVEND